jgi:hypothetical protein
MMRWFRTHIGLGSRLALFALAIQLVLSFGHIHAGKIAPASAKGAISLAQAPDRDGGPGPKPHSGADDFCAICATISLLASSALPTISSLLPPVAAEHRWLTEFTTTRISFDPFVLFQARAPPTVLI